MAKIIASEPDHQAALQELERLMDLDPQPGSPAAEELAALGLLVEDYEKKRFNIPLPDARAAVEFRADQASSQAG